MKLFSTIKIVLIYSDHCQSVKDQIGRVLRKKTSKLDQLGLKVLWQWSDWVKNYFIVLSISFRSEINSKIVKKNKVFLSNFAQTLALWQTVRLASKIPKTIHGFYLDHKP